MENDVDYDSLDTRITKLEQVRHGLSTWNRSSIHYSSKLCPFTDAFTRGTALVQREAGACQEGPVHDGGRIGAQIPGCPIGRLPCSSRRSFHFIHFSLLHLRNRHKGCSPRPSTVKGQHTEPATPSYPTGNDGKNRKLPQRGTTGTVLEWKSYIYCPLKC